MTDFVLSAGNTIRPHRSPWGAFPVRHYPISTGISSNQIFIGSLVGFVVALLFGFIDYEVLEALWRAGLIFLLAEGIENYLLIPKILGDSLGLHPIVVIFSLLAGAASLGMVGLLIALPLAASLVIVAREFVLPVLADLADQDRVERAET